MQDYLNQLSPNIKYIKSIQSDKLIKIYCETEKIPDKKIHSRYERIIKDIPYGNLEVEIHIIAKKYFNTDSSNEQLVYSEKLDFISGNKGTRTKRLDEYLLKLSKETSAIGCERHIKEIGIKVSDSTILRIVKKNH